MSLKHRYPLIWLVSLALCTVLGLALSACTPSKRVTEPPAVQISGLELLADGEARVEMMLTNLNPATLNTRSARLKLALEGVTWLETEQAVSWQVSANAREAVSLVGQTDASKVDAWLNEVAKGQRTSLPYALTLSLKLTDDRVIDSEHTGFLYRVPGQAGRFR